MRAQINYEALVYFNLTRKELYRMNPGLYYDLVQIYNDRNSSKRDPEDE